MARSKGEKVAADRSSCLERGPVRPTAAPSVTVLDRSYKLTFAVRSRNIAPTPPDNPKSNQFPFVIYNDAFSSLLGPNPALQLLMTDPRAPYFYAGGAWMPRLSTLFLTSNLIRDSDPAAVSSGNRRTEITKLEFYSSSEFTRDKVRCPDRQYMAAGCAVCPPTSSDSGPGIVICAQGTLMSPSGLVYIDARRPHKSRVLLNNFHGRPFNSPCDIVTNSADDCLYFTDPAYGYERGFRPKPQLPTGHIYRFHVETGDCRVVASMLQRPGGLAFSPDYRTLYVSELADKYGGTTIYAFDVMYSRPGIDAPSFHITTVPNTANGVNGIHKNKSSTSSNESNGSQKGSYRLAPTAAPRGLAAAANLSESGGHHFLSRSSSRSRARDPADRPAPHRQFSALSLGARSPNRGPTSEPASSRAGPSQQPSPTALTYGSPTMTGAFLANKRLFAYTPALAPSGGISVDPISRDLWLGTEEGVEVWSGATGELLGKILVAEDELEADYGNDQVKTRRTMKGVSRVAFGGEGHNEVWLFSGEKFFKVSLDRGRSSGGAGSHLDGLG